MVAFIQLIAALLVLGLIAGLVEQYAPIPRPFKVAIHVLMVLLACAIILTYAGIWDAGWPRAHLPR